LPEGPLISVVDDDISVRTATESLVRSLGYRVRGYSCAGDFLTSADRSGTRCLIADIQMPGIDGLELQRLLREARDPVPVILVTAYPEEQLRRRAEAAGAVGFLRKPFVAEVLIACIEAALRGTV
jgi:FixJ family two-component response regulator